MKIVPLIIDFLENFRKVTPIELTFIENMLCDECYKINSESLVKLPAKCLINLIDYEIKVDHDTLKLVIIKASVKSMNVSNYSKYLCLAEHSPQIIESIRKFKRDQVISMVNSTDSSLNYIPEISETKKDTLQIGFSGKNINSDFIKKRTIPKLIQSQDDILAAMIPEIHKANHIFAEPEKKKSDSVYHHSNLYDFPEWALVYLQYSLKH